MVMLLLTCFMTDQKIRKKLMDIDDVRNSMNQGQVQQQKAYKENDFKKCLRICNEPEIRFAIIVFFLVNLKP